MRPNLKLAAVPEPDVVDGTPLAVDLDGTLIRGDLLLETFASQVSHAPLRALKALLALRQGKAALKARLVDDAPPLDAADLPYDPDVLRLVREARASGRPVHLISASDERQVAAVAEHLGLFTGYAGSTPDRNLSGERKAQHLAAVFGDGGFDYIGNEKADLPVWRRARRCISVGAPGGVVRQLEAFAPSAEHLPGPTPTWKTWLKLMRVHQWAKNTLLFVTVLTDRAFTLEAIAAVTLAFVAFSLAASSIYIVNDIADLAADRSHPRKKARPLAGGAIPLKSGVLMSAALLAGGLGLAALVSPLFLLVLLAYLVLTTGYTFVLKRKMLIDSVALAGLYALRMIAGAVAIGVTPSHWLLLFALFIFTSLALVKRYVELATRLDGGLPDPTNRNYKAADLTVIASLAAASGYNAVVVFGLYLASEAARGAYNRPQLLYLVCPMLIYWLGRVLILAHRRILHDDPVVFALTDPNSRWVGMLTVLIVLAAAV